MPSINFYLDKPDRKGQSPIMLTYQDNGKRFRYFTKQKIEPRFWKDQRVKTQHPPGREINVILDDLKNTLEETLREALFSKKTLTFAQVKSIFLKKIGKVESSNDFFSCYDKFIEISKTLRKPATIRGYETTKRGLMEYEAKSGKKISFQQIDQMFYDDFVRHLLEGKRLLNNSAGKYIKTLKTFLNYAIDHGYADKVLPLKKFKVFTEEADIVYLSNDELLAIYELPGLSTSLDRVRDLFCFSCFTGLRFSDLDKLRNTHIKGGFIEIRAEKTRDVIKVPLNDYSREILSKYVGQFNEKPLPTGISNQKMNDYVKEVADVAGIHNLVELEKFNGSRKVIVRKRKCDLISTHTARRTFVTLSLEKGLRPEVVMMMTGHKSYKTFKKYIKITETVMQVEMNRLWNKPTLKAV